MKALSLVFALFLSYGEGFSAGPTMRSRPILSPAVAKENRFQARPLYMSTPESSLKSFTVAESKLVDISNGSSLGSFQENARKLSIDQIINSFALGAAVVSAGILLYQIDSSIVHHGTQSFQDVVTRVPMEAYDAYESVLSESPITTKAATSATVYAIGDIISQRTEGIDIGELDRPRILRSLIAGFIGHGPLSHCWYNSFDNFCENVLHITEWWSFFPKVAIDQLSWGPFWNNTYILLLGMMKLDSWKTIWGDMRRTTVPLIVSGLKLWPLAHCVTYGLVPVENRLLWVDLVEIIWVTILATQAAAAPSNAEKDLAADSSSK